MRATTQQFKTVVLIKKQKIIKIVVDIVTYWVYYKHIERKCTKHNGEIICK